MCVKASESIFFSSRDSRSTKSNPADLKSTINDFNSNSSSSNTNNQMATVNCFSRFISSLHRSLRSGGRQQSSFNFALLALVSCCLLPLMLLVPATDAAISNRGSSSSKSVSSSSNNGLVPRFVSRGHTYRAVVGDTLILPCEVENLARATRRRRGSIRPYSNPRTPDSYMSRPKGRMSVCHPASQPASQREKVERSTWPPKNRTWIPFHHISISISIRASEQSRECGATTTATHLDTSSIDSSSG